MEKMSILTFDIKIALGVENPEKRRPDNGFKAVKYTKF